MRVYRTRELTSDRQRIYFNARCEGATPLEAARFAGYPHPEKNWNKVENSKRMKHMLSKHAPKVFNVATPDWKVNKLVKVVERHIPDELPESVEMMGEDGKPVLRIGNQPDARTGIAAIAELNKMQGHYAPTQNQNVNVNVSADMKEAKEIAARLNSKNRYKKDY